MQVEAKYEEIEVFPLGISKLRVSETLKWIHLEYFDAYLQVLVPLEPKPINMHQNNLDEAKNEVKCIFALGF